MKRKSSNKRVIYFLSIKYILESIIKYVALLRSFLKCKTTYSILICLLRNDHFYEKCYIRKKKKKLNFLFLWMRMNDIIWNWTHIVTRIKANLIILILIV